MGCWDDKTELSALAVHLSFYEITKHENTKNTKLFESGYNLHILDVFGIPMRLSNLCNIGIHTIHITCVKKLSCVSEFIVVVVSLSDQGNPTSSLCCWCK